MKNFLYLSAFTVLLSACGNTPQPKESTQVETAAPTEACDYTYEENSASVTWTSYKLTKRAPVKGVFDSIVVSGTQTAASADQVFIGATFAIYVASINSNEAARDAKLVQNFFGNMLDTKVITGAVASINERSAKVALKLNGQELEVDGEITIEDAEISLRTNIDVSAFGAQAAVDSLNAVCTERHTGDDGVSKLWPDADVLIKASLLKVCE